MPSKARVNFPGRQDGGKEESARSLVLLSEPICINDRILAFLRRRRLMKSVVIDLCADLLLSHSLETVGPSVAQVDRAFVGLLRTPEYAHCGILTS